MRLVSIVALALLSIVVAGAGFGALLGAPTRYIVTNEIPERARATAVGLLSQALIVGQIVGSALAGGIMSARQRKSAAIATRISAFAAVAFVAVILASMLAPRAIERSRPRAGGRRLKGLARRRWTVRERRIVWRGLTGRMSLAVEPLSARSSWRY